MKTNIMDASLRFFHYVMKIPGVASYLAPSQKEFSSSQVFQYRCVSEATYAKIVSQAKRVGLSIKVHNRQKRRLIPPKFTPEDIESIKNMIKDMKIQYIVFPCLWEQYYPAVCRKQKSSQGVHREYHMVLFALNTVKKNLELWDDQFARSQIPLNYEDTLRYIDIHVQTFFANFDLKIKELRPPILPPEKIDLVRTALNEKHYHVVYMSFLANYLDRRSSEFSKLQSKIKSLPADEAKAYLKDHTSTKKDSCANIPLRLKTKVTKYLIEYDKLKAHNAMYSHFDAQNLSYQNPNIPMKSCAENEFYDVFTRLCKQVPETFGDIQVPVGQYHEKRQRKGNVMEYFYYICLYLIKKYPYMATMMPKNISDPLDYYYMLRYNYKKELDKKIRGKQQNPFVLHAPPQWERFMSRAMRDRNIRYIAVILGVNGRDDLAHANVIFIDKTNKTVQRYDPNTGAAPGVHYYWGNGPQEDEDIKAFFKACKWTTDYAFSSAAETCPIGLHRVEFHEALDNILDTGGNCALWTLYMLDLRIGNPDVPAYVVQQYALQEIAKTGSFKHFIDSYAEHVIAIGKKMRKNELQQKRKIKNN